MGAQHCNKGRTDAILSPQTKSAAINALQEQSRETPETAEISLEEGGRKTSPQDFRCAQGARCQHERAPSPVAPQVVHYLMDKAQPCMQASSDGWFGSHEEDPVGLARPSRHSAGSSSSQLAVLNRPLLMTGDKGAPPAMRAPSVGAEAESARCPQDSGSRRPQCGCTAYV